MTDAQPTATTLLTIYKRIICLKLENRKLFFVCENIKLRRLNMLKTRLYLPNGTFSIRFQIFRLSVR